MQGNGLRFSVLGPVRAWSGDVELNLGTPQSRLTLAVLLMNDGASVLVDELVDAVWPVEPPPSAVPGIRTYVSRLRRVLSEAGHDGVIEAGQGSYRLITEPHTVDARILRAEVARARQAESDGDPETATRALRTALAQWQGTPLGDLGGGFAQSHRAALHQVRLTAIDQLATVDLAAGRPVEVVSTLSTLIEEYPFDERLRELLMLGLFRCGQAADALGLFQSTSRLLGEELGVSPGPALQQLYQQILHTDTPAPGSEAIALTPPVNRPAVIPPPRQLPADLPDFTGRTAMIRDLTDRLLRPRTTAVGVTGLTGTGKTALAVHLGHQLSSEFPDGQIFATLRSGDDTPLDPHGVLAFLLVSCGIPASQLPDTLQQRAALWRSVLADRRVLVILDDAHDGTQVAPLLAGTSGSAVLITSQRRLRDLPIGHWSTLGALHPDEAVDLIRRIIGTRRVDQNLDAARELALSLSYLPMPIRAAASALQARPHWSLGPTDTQTSLILRPGGLDPLTFPGNAFERAYQRLPAHVARAFRMLSLADGGRLSVSLAAVLLNVPEREAGHLLELLTDHHLVERRLPLSYEYHAVVREYARTTAVGVDGAEACRAAMHRMRTGQERWQAPAVSLVSA